VLFGSVLFYLFCRKKVVFAVKNKGIFVRMAKRVRDAEGGVSQCGEQRSTKRSEARSSPTRRETPKKINELLSTI
jgi:hypothetical protein